MRLAIAIVIAFGSAIATVSAEPVSLSNDVLDHITAGSQGAVGAIFSNLPPGTVGPTISGVIYGNTSNPSGNGNGVLPSWSPGPWVCGNPSDCAGPTNPGGSMGEFLSPVASGGNSSSDFANGNDPNHDFSAPHL